MKANELRLGNYIGILSHTIEVSVNCQHIQLIAEGDTTYKPIPLTDEWLVKFGFYKFEHDHYKSREWNIREEFNPRIIFGLQKGTIKGRKVMNAYKSHHLVTSVEYVHQLQNLYFALTGEELMIRS